MIKAALLALVPPLLILAIAVIAAPAAVHTLGGLLGVSFLAVMYLSLVSRPLLSDQEEDELISATALLAGALPVLSAALIVGVLAFTIGWFSWQWVLLADLAIGIGALAVGAGLLRVSRHDAERSAEIRHEAGVLRTLAADVVAATESHPEHTIVSLGAKVAEQIRLAPIKGAAVSRGVEHDIDLAVAALNGMTDGAELQAALEEISKLVAARNEVLRAHR